MAFAVEREPSLYVTVTKYTPECSSPKCSSLPGFSIVFTTLPETSATETDFTSLVSAMYNTSLKGFGYTLISLFFADDSTVAKVYR